MAGRHELSDTWIEVLIFTEQNMGGGAFMIPLSSMASSGLYTFDGTWLDLSKRFSSGATVYKRFID